MGIYDFRNTVRYPMLTAEMYLTENTTAHGK